MDRGCCRRIGLALLLGIAGLSFQEADPAEERVGALIAKLASANLTDRDDASAELAGMGRKIVPILRRRLALLEDAETAARLRAVIDALDRAAIVHVKDLDLGETWSTRIAAAGPIPGHVWLAGDRGGQMRVLNPERWTEAAAPDLATYEIGAIAVSPSGARMAVSVPDRVLIFERATRLLLGTVPVNFRIVHRLQFVNENQLIFLVTDGLAAAARAPSHLYRIVPKEKSWVVEDGPEASGFNLAVSSDGRWIAVGDLPRGKMARAIEVSTGRVVATLPVPMLREGPQGTGNGLAFTPDSRFLICEGWNGVLLLFSTATWTLTGKIEGVKGHHPVVVTPDSVNVAYVGEGPTMRLWNLKKQNDEASIPLKGTHQRLLGSAGRHVLVAWSGQGGFRNLSIFRIDRP